MNKSKYDLRLREKFNWRVLAGFVCVVIIACSPASRQKNENGPTLSKMRIDQQLATVFERHKIKSAGAVVIQNAEISWSGYFGLQSPGVPTTKNTLFNVASITKTITAELILQLVEAREISLDEPMSSYWVDPDLNDDLRHKELTPRIALAHRTGFLNWRYMDDESKLKFVSDPNAKYGYSGEGYEYLARFAEKKTKQDFQSLVEHFVFNPNELTNISLSPQPWVYPRMVQPVDADGISHKPFCNANGSRCSRVDQWSAADEMVTTVEDYAHFMISVMRGDKISRQLQTERFTVLSSTADDPILACPFEDKTACPRQQGFGLGWEVYQFDDATIVSHGGSDWSERAMAYFDRETNHGIVLFLNGSSENSLEAMIEVLEILDSGSRIAAMYRGWVAAYRKQQVKTDKK